jgi:hypothetical protein
MRCFRFVVVASTIAVAFLSFATTLSNAAEFRTVALSGVSGGNPVGPQLETGVSYGLFTKPVINDAGQAAFRAELLDGGTAVWRWENGSKQLLLRTSTQAPGLPPGALVGSLSSAFEILIDDAGGILTRTLLGGTASSSNDLALLHLGDNGVPTVVAREGSPAPGLGGIVHGSSVIVPTEGALSDSGAVLFRMTVAGPGVSSENDRVLWYGNPASPTPLFREGSPTPAFGASATVGSISGAVSYARGSQLATAVPINDGDTDSALYAGTSGSLAAIAFDGLTVPSLGVDLGSFRSVKVNGTGQVLFGATTSTGSGVFLYTSGVFSSAGQEGQSAPGTTEVFGPLSSSGVNQIAFTESGDAAFYGALAASATISAANDGGIWVYDDGASRLAVREGDLAPGLSGVTYGQIQHWAFNNQEDLLFVAELEGAVSDGVDDLALWHTTAEGLTSKLLQTGDLFDVDTTAATDFRTISRIAIGGTSAGGNSQQSTEQGLTDSRLLLMNLSFTDGTSGLFVTTLVPEPTSLLLLALAGLAIVASRR